MLKASNDVAGDRFGRRVCHRKQIVAVLDHRFDETALKYSVDRPGEGRVFRRDDIHAQRIGGFDLGAKPSLILPLVGRMREVTRAVVGPSPYVPVVDRFLERSKKLRGRTRFEPYCHFLLPNVGESSDAESFRVAAVMRQRGRGYGGNDGVRGKDGRAGQCGCIGWAGNVGR